MTGTSIDAVDAAAVRIRGRGLGARGECLGVSSAPLGDLRGRLRGAQRQEPMSAGEFARLAHDIALAHLPPLRDLVRRHGTPDLVVVHGQTLFHAPPISLQLIDPSVVAHDLGVSVASGLRAADLAAGGQGAPITPLADWMMFRSRSASRFVVNLGGFANATLVPSCRPGATREEWIDTIRGFDVCLCNQLLDHIARTRAGMAFDDGGAMAVSGTADAQVTDGLAAELDRQRRARRSLGTRDELVESLSQFAQHLSPRDALASAVSAIGGTIACALDELLPPATRGRGFRVLLAGGGARNAALARSIALACQAPATPTDSLGVPIEARESMAMALLGAAAIDGAPITLAQVTGRGALRCADAALIKLPA